MEPSSRPTKPSKSQLKQQARLLEQSLFKPSEPIKIEQFIRQLSNNNPTTRTKTKTKTKTNSNQHLKAACTLNDLMAPIETIYKDSNLLSELKDHQHELATPHGSLHALHLLSESAHDHITPSLEAEPPSKKKRLIDPASDIPVHIPQQAETTKKKTTIPDYLDPSLVALTDPPPSSSSKATPDTRLLSYDHTFKPPRRVRKKAAGPPQSIMQKPKPIQDLINRLSATGLKTLQPDFDGMWYVRSVGRSDWNTSTQPMHSNLAHPTPLSTDPEPVVITITLHPFSKTSAGQESSSEAKAVAPRKQTLHMLSSQTLSDLRDVVVCSATQIPVCSHDGNQWLDQRWISGSAFIIQNVLFADTRPIPSPLDDHSAGKSDYGLLLQELLPDLIAKDKVENLLTIDEQENEKEMEGMANETQAAPKKKSKIQISSLSMEQVRMDQLTLRINEPYWMLHQGNCEHIFTIDEIRALHPTDPAPHPTPVPVPAGPSRGDVAVDVPAATGTGTTTAYPITSFLSRISSPKCRVCDRDPARLVAIDDELCVESPCFICLTCFKFLHSNTADLEKNTHPSSSAAAAAAVSPSSSSPSSPASPSSSSSSSSSPSSSSSSSGDMPKSCSDRNGKTFVSLSNSTNLGSEMKIQFGKVPGRTWWVVPLLGST
ncbi:hypothetical protein PCANC_09223 [Puccinia coronata f. sp. avenae]|uniref:snRNA-activating protein complex subunit 3 n=1 Tax=Puccinia coronata f. sp. avenae TaxID=200324 RepID=A0A2N5UXE9_9BASI|nr:hypothetical protein PCANC_09223 [Puccinia coronata f. sp. avenae]PLW42441.1 hypothetical protein PCASD_04668 [Puccinia coronata f. sp. avenae]